VRRKNRQAEGTWAAGIALAILWPAGSASAALPAAAMRGGWLAGAVTSWPVLKYGLIAAVCAALLAVLGALLWQAGRGQRRCRRGQDGAAIIEFALALPFALMLTLILVQSCLLMGASICVSYSAFCAARSAAVVVPLDLSGADCPEPRKLVLESPPADKHGRIRGAAVWALLPVASSSDRIAVTAEDTRRVQHLLDGLERYFAAYGWRKAAGDYPGLAPDWAYRHLARKMKYAEDHTEVELGGGQQIRGTLPDGTPATARTYAGREDVQVTVRHTLYLSVPYARSLFRRLGDGVDLPDLGPGECGVRIEVDCRLTNEGVQDFVDVEHFPAT